MKGTMFATRHLLLNMVGGNIVVWGCSFCKGVGLLFRVEGIMDRFVYKDILDKQTKYFR